MDFSDEAISNKDSDRDRLPSFRMINGMCVENLYRSDLRRLLRVLRRTYADAFWNTKERSEIFPTPVSFSKYCDDQLDEVRNLIKFLPPVIVERFDTSGCTDEDIMEQVFHNIDYVTHHATNILIRSFLKPTQHLRGHPPAL